MIHAGAAQVSITPPLGTHLSGSGMGDHRSAASILDPLFVRAVVFDDVATRVCIISLELCIVASEFSDRIRRELETRFGLMPESILIHSLQSHSAPSCGFMMLDPDFPLQLTPQTEYLQGGETRYFELAVRGTIEAVGRAIDALKPVQVASGWAVKSRLAFNRRGIMRDGSISMPWFGDADRQPLGPVNLRYLEGPDDPEIGVFAVRGNDESLMAFLLHFTCHPVNVFANPATYLSASSDWPGAWSAQMQSLCGADCVPLVLNGCCGNINPWDPFDPGFKPDHRRMGASLAEMTRRVIGTMRFKSDARLAIRRRVISLPYRAIPPARLEEARRILAANPEPPRQNDGQGQVEPEWFYAASTMSIEYCKRRHPRGFPYDIQVMRIGDTAIVGLPGEPFVEGQLAIKIASPATLTLVAHLCTHYVGYLPTREGALHGGHEANPSCTYWAKLAPEALDMVVAETGSLLKEVFAGPADAEPA